MKAAVTGQCLGSISQSTTLVQTEWTTTIGWITMGLRHSDIQLKHRYSTVPVVIVSPFVYFLLTPSGPGICEGGWNQIWSGTSHPLLPKTGFLGPSLGEDDQWVFLIKVSVHMQYKWSKRIIVEACAFHFIFHSHTLKVPWHAWCHRFSGTAAVLQRG